MAAFPITPSTGDPIFRGISSSIDSVRRFSRMGSDSAVKLNTQERVVSPGEDALSFAASRGLRSQLGGLKAVQESGQINVTTLNLAIEGLEAIRTQLDGVKRLLVQSQAATAEERSAFQAEVDLALKQIDATAHNTKISGRGLLNGESTIRGFNALAVTTGQATEFATYAGGLDEGAAGGRGVQAVRVNQIGVGGPTVRMDDGSLKLSLKVSILQANEGQKAVATIGGGAAGGYSDFRITGKLGSATIRILSSAGPITANSANDAAIQAFNSLAAETGVVFAETNVANVMQVTSVGSGNDDFVKVEFIGGNTTGVTLGGVGGAGSAGTTFSNFGRAAVALVNGQRVSLGGEFGTTIHYQSNGFDIEMDMSTVNLTGGAGGGFSTDVNVRLDAGTAGLLGSSGRMSDAVRFGVGQFTTDVLGKGNGQNSSANTSGLTVSTTQRGNFLVGNSSVADIGTGGPLQLASGKIAEAMRTIDRAVAQVVKEQSRLGVLQSNFMDAIARAEVAQGNISAADSDILGVDAAAEITNIVQAQVGVSTATALSSQITGIQQTVLSMLRG